MTQCAAKIKIAVRMKTHTLLISEINDKAVESGSKNVSPQTLKVASKCSNDIPCFEQPGIHLRNKAGGGRFTFSPSIRWPTCTWVIWFFLNSRYYSVKGENCEPNLLGFNQ